MNNEDKAQEIQSKIESVLESVLITSFIYGFIMILPDKTIRDSTVSTIRSIINFSLLYKLQILKDTTGNISASATQMYDSLINELKDGGEVGDGGLDYAHHKHIDQVSSDQRLNAIKQLEM